MIQSTQTSGQVIVNHNVRKFAIVQPGSFQARLVELEAERLYEVQLCASIGTKAYDIAGIGGISGSYRMRLNIGYAFCTNRCVRSRAA